jgi:hypothetical protein
MNEKTRKRPMLIIGKSGAGKSETVFQASDFLAQHVEDWRGVVDIRASTLEPTDGKLPFPDKEAGIARFLPTDLFPTEGSGIIFLDEITSCPKAVQPMMYQVALSPQDYGIPAGWMVVAAGNHQSDRGATVQLSPVLVTRFCRVEVEPVLDDFLMHAVTKGIRPEVTSFLKDRPDFLHKFEPVGEAMPFPNPRSWFAVSDAMALELPEEIRPDILAGDVGEEAAISFEAHLRVFGEMPRLNDILEGKDVDVPQKLNVVYCCAMGLAARVDKDNFANAWKFLSRCPGDVQTLTVKLAYKRDKTIAKSPAYAKWAMKNQDAFAA